MTLAETMQQHRLHWLLVLTGLVIVYAGIVSRMVGDWAYDPNYSHGFLVPVISGWFVWMRLPELRKAVVRPSNMGLAVMLASLALLVFGMTTAELYTSRLSLVVLLAGIILYLFGMQVFRLLFLPVAFLVFMIPLPYTVYDTLALPLKAIVSTVATGGLKLLGFPVLREGNVILFPNVTLEVVDACSGLRSLVSLMALGTAFAFIFLAPGWRRLVLILCTIPIAVFTNIIRVFVTGFLARFIGSAAAEGFFHEFAGLAVFVTAMALTAGTGWLLSRMGGKNER